MKKLNLIMTVVVSAAMMFTGCEKDIATNPMETKSNKSSYFIEKSNQNLFDEIIDFIDATINFTIEKEYNAEDALLFTESAINFRLTNNEYLPLESELFSFDYEVMVMSDGENLYIEADEIQLMNDYIYDVIFQNAENYDFDNGNKDGKIISIIDFKIDDLESGINIFTIEYVLSNFIGFPTLPSVICSDTLSWYPVMNMGGCNGNLATTSDAAQELSRIVNSGNCNQYINPCPFPLWFDIQSSEKYSLHSSLSHKSLWRGGFNDCIDPIRLHELRDSCIWVGQQTNINNWPNYDLLKIVITNNLLLSNNNGVWFHEYEYFFGKCVGNEDALTLHYNNPCFEC